MGTIIFLGDVKTFIGICKRGTKHGVIIEDQSKKIKM